MRPILVDLRLALALGSVAALVGCGALQGVTQGVTEGVDPGPHPEVTAPDAAVRLVEKAEADLVLYVSNQSFDDEDVRLTVTVDDITVVDGDFHVEGQHNWIRFPLAMAPGEHEITAASDSGAELQRTFTVPISRTRYAVIDHWTEDRTELSWQFSRQPVAFA